MDISVIAEIDNRYMKELLGALKEIRCGAYEKEHRYDNDGVEDSIYSKGTAEMLDRVDDLISRVDSWISSEG